MSKSVFFNQRIQGKVIAICVALAVWVGHFEAKGRFAYARLSCQSDVAEAMKEYDLDAEAFKRDHEKGFKVAFGLLVQADKENASPEIIAKLSYYAAKYAVPSLGRGSEKITTYTRKLTILKSVVRKPDVYLVNDESCRWYVSCTKALISARLESGDPREDIDEELNTAFGLIKEAKGIEDRRRLFANNELRMHGSDLALKEKDWARAVEWVEPLIESATLYLSDDEGAGRIAMATRQQSMFLAMDGQIQNSTKLIDDICAKIDAAENVSEAKKISGICMLRGKYFVNASMANRPELYEVGVEAMLSVSERAEKYDGQNQELVLASYLDMYRLSCRCITQKSPQLSLDLAKRAIQECERKENVMKSNPRMFSSLEEILQLGLPASDETRRLQKAASELKQRVQQ